MRRVDSKPRSNLSTRIADLGFRFAESDDGQIYWDETLRFEFTLTEIEHDLEAPTVELWEMCLEVASQAASDEAMLSRLGIPPDFHDLVSRSWQERAPTLYGRFDLSYDGRGPAKMLELNADTPTSLYEAAVFQWHWLEDSKASGALPQTADQFNSLHERLIERWREIASVSPRIHLACMENMEDQVTVEYLADCALQAGLDASCMLIRDIGLQGGRFVDLAEQPVGTLFKLYPWEWLIKDQFASADAMHSVRIIEPAWKMMLSNKGLLAELWRLYPRHPNLLESYHVAGDGSHRLAGRPHVLKPIHAREGANITVMDINGPVAKTSGTYDGPLVAQLRADNLFRTDDGHAVIGSWIVGSQASGIGIREDAGLVTTNMARFVPHAIV